MRRLRQARGLSLGEFAGRAGVSKASLQDWETGRYVPPVAALDRLLEALGADARTQAWLLAGVGTPGARALLSHTQWGAPVDLGQVLRAMRLRRGRVQADVAQAVGVRQGTLAKWEGGDALPADEPLGRLLAALSATPEETDALRMAMHGPSTRETDVEARIAGIAHNQPVALRDVLLIGLEAELWGRAMREPAADSALARTMAVRAQQAIVRGAWLEIVPHARRAVRLGRATGEADSVAAALYAANWVRQRTPGGAPAAARSLARWAERMRSPDLRNWLVSSQGLALVRAGEIAQGVAVLEAQWGNADAGSWPWRFYGEDLIEAWLLAGEPEGAERVLDALGTNATDVAAAKVAAASGKAPPPELLARLRAQPDQIGRDEAVRIERLLARVRRGGSPTLV